ncbi:hypothetical protein C8R46DRAFT_1247865 [Mycena filopes]|nr:hypothetical protein C8R46DRAFT_1247865 [Mycena filopes]
MDFQKICTTLGSHPEVATTFSHTDVVNIASSTDSPRERPRIPAASFGVEDETAKLAWEIFRSIAWAFDPSPEEQQANRVKHVKLFLRYGVEQRIGVHSLSPPTRVCLDPNCSRPLRSDSSILRDRELVEPADYPITVFTLDLGAVPGYSTSCYCRNCHTRYYPNYYVHAGATTRTYYVQDNIPEFIHSAEHFYTSADLCELFANMMATAWTSGTNCARIYNTSISKHALQPFMPTGWLSLQMDVDDVYNSFFLHALLLDHHERNDIFQLRHNAPSQTERLRPALEARNIRMADTAAEQERGEQAVAEQGIQGGHGVVEEGEGGRQQEQRAGQRCRAQYVPCKNHAACGRVDATGFALKLNAFLRSLSRGAAPGCAAGVTALDRPLGSRKWRRRKAEWRHRGCVGNSMPKLTRSDAGKQMGCIVEDVRGGVKGREVTASALEINVTMRKNLKRWVITLTLCAIFPREATPVDPVPS